ncbi:MAG: choice-of-anchor D domain-containing protein [Myxococcales bacterium]|nr:choice-of-anchor D domain-containing protein [Myxococcales bacterium]
MDRKLLLAALIAAGAAHATHPMSPVSLLQQDGAGNPLAAGATLSGSSVKITASSDSSTCGSPPDYKLDIELRPLASAFTGTPTHSSALMSKPSCIQQQYPWTTISGIVPGPYKWQVREVVGTSPSSWVQFNAGSTAFTIASGPYALLNPSTTLAFGNQRVGVVSQPMNIEVSNPGNQNLVITNATVTASFAIASGPTSTTVVPGSKVTYGITVNPPAMGPLSGSFTLTSDTGGTPGTQSVVALTANGSLPQLSLPTTSFNFGDVGINSTPASLPVTVNNNGQAPLTLASASVSNGVFGSTGAAGLIIPPAGSKTFDVTFAPVAQGAQTATLTLNSDDPNSPHTLSLSGNGIAPKLLLSLSTIAFGDVTVGATSQPTTVTITNTGTGALGIGSASLSGPFSTTGLSPGSLAQAASRQFTASFVPTTPGPMSGTLTIPSNDAASPATIALSGTARAPQLSAAPASYGFGQVNIGGSGATTVVTLSNAGDAPLDIQSLTFTGANPNDFSLPSGPTPPTQIAAGGSLQVTVKFAPADHLARAADWVIQSNKYPAGTVSVALTGSGVGPKADVAPNSLSYGTVNVNAAPVTKQVTVTNNGETNLSVTSVVFSGSAGADFSTPTSFPISLAPTQSSTIDITFKPGGPGPRNGKASVVSNDPLLANADVALDGTGVSPAVQLSPMVLNFGNVRVGGSVPMAVTVSNNGNGPLTLTGTSVGGTDAARFNLGAFGTPQTLAPGGSAQLQVTFSPTALGIAGAQLTVTSDDPNAPNAMATLVGNGTSPTLALSVSRLDFGAQMVGRASRPRPVEIRNTGSATLTVSALSVGGQQAQSFTTQASPTPFTINPGDKASVGVTLNPASVGEHNARLTVTSDDTTATQANVDLSGVGVSTLLSVSPTSLAFGSMRTGVSSEAKSVTLSNTSGDSVVLLGGSLSGPQASSFIVSTQSGTVGPGGTTTASVVFRPASGGPSQAQLSFQTADPSVPPAVVNLSGEGVSKLLEVTPQSLDFGTVAVGDKSAPQTLEVTNLSNQPLSFRATSSDESFVIDASAPTSLAAGAVGQVSVSFAPKDPFQQSGTIDFTTQGKSAPDFSVTVAGSGIRGGIKPCGCGASGAPLLALALLPIWRLRRRRG